jgi:large subunit ribosomal protein L21
MKTNFSVIKLSGRQYIVSVGDQFQVEKLDKKVNEKILLTEVLLNCIDNKIVIGTPLVKNSKVEGEVISQIKGKKIRIIKYKAKSRYRKRIGHRQKYTIIKITKIQ